jgi:hypothetical protein
MLEALVVLDRVSFPNLDGELEIGVKSNDKKARHSVSHAPAGPPSLLYSSSVCSETPSQTLKARDWIPEA